MPEDARLETGRMQLREELICLGVALGSKSPTTTRKQARPLTSCHFPLEERAAHLYTMVVPCFHRAPSQRAHSVAESAEVRWLRRMIHVPRDESECWVENRRHRPARALCGRRCSKLTSFWDRTCFAVHSWWGHAARCSCGLSRPAQRSRVVEGTSVVADCPGPRRSLAGGRSSPAKDLHSPAGSGDLGSGRRWGPRKRRSTALGGRRAGPALPRGAATRMRTRRLLRTQLRSSAVGRWRGKQSVDIHGFAA